MTVLCGEDAGMWTRKYNTKLYQPSMDLLQCEKVEKQENSQGTISLRLFASLIFGEQYV